MAITMTFQANVRKTAPEVQRLISRRRQQPRRPVHSPGTTRASRAGAAGQLLRRQLKEANAWTALITVPSTLANLALQNGEAAGGKSYIIDRIWVKAVTTLAAGQLPGDPGPGDPGGDGMVADSANKTIYSLSGKPNYGGKAQIAVASTAVGAVADKWSVVGALGSLPTSTWIAAAFEALVYGRYIIPPGHTFALNAQEAVSGGTLIAGVEWHECILDLG